MDLLADFLHFGTSVFLLHVGLEQCEVWGVKSAVWSVKCEGSSGKWEVWSVECEVWSLSLECEERSVKCEVWGLECEGSSEKCGVWNVKCGVWSLKFGVRRVHLCLGNFRRRLARVYVIWLYYIRIRIYLYLYLYIYACIWVNYKDLSSTSLEWWSGITIPKWFFSGGAGPRWRAWSRWSDHSCSQGCK